MTSIHIRNVPDDVHRILKERAALSGMSLSGYARQLLRQVAAEPTQDEVFERLSRRHHPPLPEPAADVVRAMRDNR